MGSSLESLCTTYRFTDVHVTAVLNGDLALLGGQWTIRERRIARGIVTQLFAHHEGLLDVRTLWLVDESQAMHYYCYQSE